VRILGYGGPLWGDIGLPLVVLAQPVLWAAVFLARHRRWAPARGEGRKRSAVAVRDGAVRLTLPLQGWGPCCLGSLVHGKQRAERNRHSTPVRGQVVLNQAAKSTHRR
jgi:hypothetical protein